MSDSKLRADVKALRDKMLGRFNKDTSSGYKKWDVARMELEEILRNNPEPAEAPAATALPRGNPEEPGWYKITTLAGPAFSHYNGSGFWGYSFYSIGQCRGKELYGHRIETRDWSDKVDPYEGFAEQLAPGVVGFPPPPDEEVEDSDSALDQDDPNANPTEPGWYKTRAVGQDFFSHFDGEMWGAGWWSMSDRRSKERLAHLIPSKQWINRVDTPDDI